jgi:hypothetical protein
MLSGSKGSLRLVVPTMVVGLLGTLALLFAYLTVVNVLISFGRMSDDISNHNPSLQWATTIAPWSAEAQVAYAAHLRRYALNASPMEKAETLATVNKLIKSAMVKRPLWPYYQLAKYDAEVLSGASDDVLQIRFDSIRSLAPNERGVDFSLIQTSLYAWDSLKESQQSWIGAQLLRMQREKREELLRQIVSLKGDNPRLCTQLPWRLVKRACQE